MKKINCLAAIIVACLLLCACSFPVYAVDLPSSLSADYTGGQYGCRLLLQTVGATGQNGLEAKCTLPSNEQATGLVIGPQACPSDAYIVPLAQWGQSTSADKAGTMSFVTLDGTRLQAFGPGIANKTPSTWLRITAYTPTSVEVRIGGLIELQLGGGVPITFTREQTVLVSSPYPGCGATAPNPSQHLARLCRTYGIYCGG